MPQTKPEFERLDEYTVLAEQIIEKHPGVFAGVELNTIRAFVITNKERGESKPKLFDIKAVADPIRMDLPYGHYVIFHQEDWNMLEQKHKLLLVAQTLCAVPIDENGEMIEGKVKSFDMKDYSTMLRTFGTDYLVKDNVPDLLEDEIKWVE
jgi:hypothetical protein